MYKHFFKRFFDIVIASFGLLIISPIFIVTIVVLFFDNNGKPFFFQKRPGKQEKLFKIIKFKTMNDKMDSSGNLLSDGERLTKIGKFIRENSLDEIPQLLNVIIGDMSLVGPRPLLPQYLPLYNDVQKRRHEVKPGITGWAQVNGRNAISWEQKFEYDLWYLDNISCRIDIKIIFLSIEKIKVGINSINSATSEPFNGN